MTRTLKDTYKNKKVFITGITGFKGSWLALLLHRLGAEVKGLGLKQSEQNTIFYKGEIEKIAKVYIQDLRDDFSEELTSDIQGADYIFHLAAQPIVSEGYRDPYGTFNTNVMGTVKMLELVKNSTHEVSFLSVASDRVYASVPHPHVETDSMAGFEPYSLSKVFDNMLVDMYSQMDGVSDKVKFINARASNVLGGGDKGINRIVTSIIDAVEKGATLKLRNPAFVRPYLYVLDCLSQYLIIASYGTYNAYNIGAGEHTSVSVQELVESFIKQSYHNLKWDNTGEQFGFEGNTLLVNTDRFHNEFPKVNSVCDTIDDVVNRILLINNESDKELAKQKANTLIDEAISIYNEF